VVFLSHGTPLFRLGSMSQDQLMTLAQRAGDLQLQLTNPVEIRICEKKFFSVEKLTLYFHFLLWLFLGTPDSKKMLLQKHPVATRSCKEIANFA